MARGAEDFRPSDIALSHATGDAVHAAGKQAYVANMLGRSQPTINAWANPEAAEQIPLRLVPALEEMAAGQDGWPHITRTLALMQGFELFRLPKVDVAVGDWLTKVAAISTESAEITTKICAGLADDQKVCRDDIRRLGLIEDADQLLALALQMRAQLLAVVGE